MYGTMMTNYLVLFDHIILDGLYFGNVHRHCHYSRLVHYLILDLFHYH